MARRKNSDSDSAAGRKWKIGDIGRFLKNSLIAMFKGEFLLRLRIDRIFPQIAFAFFLSLCAIIYNLMVDKTLVKVEDNKKTLQELEIQYTQKTYELVQLSRRSTVSTLLQQAGSKVAEPRTPATVLRAPEGRAARRQEARREARDSVEQTDSIQDNG